MNVKIKIISFIILILFAFYTKGNAGPFAPAAGQPGSTAISKDEPGFAAWATAWSDYRSGVNLDDNWKTPEMALGPAEGNSFDIVGLGAGGEITLIFNTPIVDGPGADFAVFENSFSDIFIELAYVEASADGVHFIRFTNQSLTAEPVGPYGAIDPTNVDGLAGKYRQGFGTPFDLADIGLTTATCVKLIDVVGNGTYADDFNHIIYDPFPTGGSAGFDLDAVGVLNAGMGPQPDIKANGMDGAVIIAPGQPPELSLTLAGHALGMITADWWIVAYHNGEWQSYAWAPHWLPGFPLTPILQYPLVDLNTPFSPALQPLAGPGPYVFFFAVDAHANGLLDFPLYYDFVTVEVKAP